MENLKKYQTVHNQSIKKEVLLLNSGIENDDHELMRELGFSHIMNPIDNQVRLEKEYEIAKSYAENIISEEALLQYCKENGYVFNVTEAYKGVVNKSTLEVFKNIENIREEKIAGNIYIVAPLEYFTKGSNKWYGEIFVIKKIADSRKFANTNYYEIVGSIGKPTFYKKFKAIFQKNVFTHQHIETFIYLSIIWIFLSWVFKHHISIVNSIMGGILLLKLFLPPLFYGVDSPSFNTCSYDRDGVDIKKKVDVASYLYSYNKHGNIGTFNYFDMFKSKLVTLLILLCFIFGIEQFVLKPTMQSIKIEKTK